MRSRLVALLTGLLALAAAGPASAAEPSSGSVGPTSQTTKWTGEFTDPLGIYDVAMFYVEDTAGTCVAPVCDTYTLTVGEYGDTLSFKWVTDGAENIAAELVDPGGRRHTLNDADLVTDRKYETAPVPGEWIVRTYGSGVATYEASATLLFAPPEGEDGAPAPTPTPPSAAPPAQPETKAKASVAKSARSARRIKKSKSLPVKVSFSAPVTNVRVGLLKGSTTYAIGTAKKVGSSATVRVRPRRTVKPGSYKVVVAATDGQGRRVGKTVNVKIGR